MRRFVAAAAGLRAGVLPRLVTARLEVLRGALFGRLAAFARFVLRLVLLMLFVL